MNIFSKRNVLIFLLLFMFATSISGAITDAIEVKSFLRGVSLQFSQEEAIPIQGLFYHDRIYLPLRYLGENLNAQIHWDEVNNRISIIPEPAFQDFPEANPWNHETFVYGEILKIDLKENTILIEEHYDDQSRFTTPALPVSSDAVIILQRNDKKMNLAFKDLKIGDQVGMVLTGDHKVRGIILNR